MDINIAADILICRIVDVPDAKDIRLKNKITNRILRLIG